MSKPRNFVRDYSRPDRYTAEDLARHPTKEKWRAAEEAERAAENEPVLIKTVDDLDALLSRPGVYKTTSEHQAYGVLRALDWDPRVDVVSELFDTGVNTIVVRVDPKGTRRVRRNPEVMGFDPAYWSNKLDGYPHWETAWWRECIQNSRDAGATRVELECVEELFEGQPAIRCTVRDDGKGMTEEVLRKAFLMFGGSVKEAGSVGGFGDAKELIIIPWLGYKIRTQSAIAIGKHNGFDITHGPHVNGVEVTAWMPREKATTATFATALLDRCNLPNIYFTVNGRRYKADAGGGELKDEAEIRRGGERVGLLRIFHNPRSRRRGFLIRARGLFMFEKYVPESQYKGIVYIELEGNAKDLFDQKRVNLQWVVADMVDRFIADLTVDKSALERMGKNKERKFYDGDKFEVNAGKAAEAAAKLAMEVPVNEMKKWKDEMVSFEPAQVNEIVEGMERADEEEAREESRGEPATIVVRVPGAMRAMLDDTRFVGRDHAANAMRLITWKPAFLLVNEVDFFAVPQKARPEGMSPTYKTLLTLWAELCRFSLMRLGWTKPFGVGFIFSWDDEKGTTTLAAYTRESNCDFLLLNPFKLKVLEKKRDDEGDVTNIKYEDEERWRVADDETLKMLCAAVIHEATHMVNGLSQHNESFAAALTENMGALIDMLPVAKKIRSAVTSRKARAERRAGQVETKKKKVREVTFEEATGGNLVSVVEYNGNIDAEIIQHDAGGVLVPTGWRVSLYVGPLSGHVSPPMPLDVAKQWALQKIPAAETRSAERMQVRVVRDPAWWDLRKTTGDEELIGGVEHLSVDGSSHTRGWVREPNGTRTEWKHPGAWVPEKWLAWALKELNAVEKPGASKPEVYVRRTPDYVSVFMAKTFAGLNAHKMVAEMARDATGWYVQLMNMGPHLDKWKHGLESQVDAIRWALQEMGAVEVAEED